MTLVSFWFILAGVLLNATAQLLLKAGTNAMPLGAARWRSSRTSSPASPATWSAWWCGSSRCRASPVSIAYPMLSSATW